MTQHLYIVTGASRGMGAAIADQLLVRGHRLLGISRRTNLQLAQRAHATGADFEQWEADLAQAGAVAARLQAWFTGLRADRFASATLINNAAALTRSGAIDQVADDELAMALRVGLEAPVLLTAAFLRATQGWAAQRRVLNISSGLGRRAMAGQASYCAVKAGLDHFTRALTLDEAQRPNGARVASLAPGVVDTDMQAQLRSADAAGFPELANFQALKDKGQLTSPTDAAARVLGYLNQADFGANPVDDVRNH